MGGHHFKIPSAPIRDLSLIVAILVFGVSKAVADASSISAVDAIKFVGRVATVCGQVVSAKYAESTNGQPTFLNLDEPYPNQLFTAVIWGKDRAAFSYPPESLAHRHICVTGKIQLYREKAEIIVSVPSQIEAAK